MLSPTIVIPNIMQIAKHIKQKKIKLNITISFNSLIAKFQVIKFNLTSFFWGRSNKHMLEVGTPLPYDVLPIQIFNFKTFFWVENLKIQTTIPFAVYPQVHTPNCAIPLLKSTFTTTHLPTADSQFSLTSSPGNKKEENMAYIVGISKRTKLRRHNNVNFP